MAKGKTEKVSVEIDPDELGVASRHHFLMANDPDYRERALTPPGGKAPDVELPDDQGVSAGAIAAALAK